MSTVRSCVNKQELKSFTQELDKKNKKYMVFKNSEPLFIRGRKVKWMVRYDIEGETEKNGENETLLYKK